MKRTNCFYENFAHILRHNPQLILKVVPALQIWQTGELRAFNLGETAVISFKLRGTPINSW